jgi:FtsZ-binding cell division protein ZapB
MKEGSEKKAGEKNAKISSGKPPRILVIIPIVLALILAALVFVYFSQRKQMFQMEEFLTQQKDSLFTELEVLKVGYDTLKTNNDSLQGEIESKVDRIDYLLAINANNVVTIKKIQSENSTLRDALKSFIMQVDSLNRRNQELMSENREIKEQISTVQQTNQELSRTNEEISSRIEKAEVILARDIYATGVNKRNKEVDRIEKMEVIRICFTLRENSIADPGEKEVFMRILRPDSLVLTQSPDNLFTYKDEEMIYSASRKVDYLNQDVEMCIYYQEMQDLIVGTYTVELYLQGSLIGTTTMTLDSRRR